MTALDSIRKITWKKKYREDVSNRVLSAQWRMKHNSNSSGRNGKTLTKTTGIN